MSKGSVGRICARAKGVAAQILRKEAAACCHGHNGVEDQRRGKKVKPKAVVRQPRPARRIASVEEDAENKNKNPGEKL